MILIEIMNVKSYKILEFIILFIVIPVSFAINYSLWLKLSIGCLGFIYIIYVLVKIESVKLQLLKKIKWKPFWVTISKRFFIIAIFTIVFVCITDSSSLFNILLNKPLKWLILLFFYSFFSVLPQELIYRTFFFKRYAVWFKNNKTLIFINSLLFALAHLFFDSILVLILTFVGGLFFSSTYKKRESTLLVTIEHAIYGCWLLTVGMGSFLGFPV